MANLLLGSLADPFTAASLNPALWPSTSGGLASIVAPGRVGVQVSAAFPSLGSGTYDATGQNIYGKVTPATAGTGGKSVTTLFQLQLDSQNMAQFACVPGTSFKAQVVTAGVTSSTTLPAYDPAAHAWWRIRETGGSFEFAASADGYSWTVLATASHSWAVTGLRFFFIAGTGDGTVGSSAYLEYLNTMTGPTGRLPSWPQVRFQVAFNQGANTSGQPAYVDLSSRIRQTWSAEQSGRQYELDQVQSGQLSMTLWNLDGALDPLNTASPYSPNVLPMRPCRLQAIWPRTRNLLPLDYANGTSPASWWYAWAGTVSAATGLAPSPPGHTTATAWQFPITASGANGYPLLTGTTGSGADSSAFPVTAGSAYSAQAWLSRSAGGDASLAVFLQLHWYSATGAEISHSASASTTVPVTPVWAQATVTGTAPAGAVSCRVAVWLATTSTTAVNTIYVTALQLEQAAAVTPWVSGGALYPLWAGYVERWPQQWDYSGTYGMVDITCVDALAALAQFTLQPSFRASLQALGPSLMYPFTEPSGSTSFADAMGRNPPRVARATPLGNGGGSITAGNSVQGAGSVGSAGPVVTITNPTHGSPNPGAGMFLDCVKLEAPPASGGWTRIVCFRTTTVPTSGNQLALWVATGPGQYIGQTGSKGIAGLYVDSTQHVQGSVSNSAGTAAVTLNVPDVNVCDGNWHTATIKLSSDGKSFTVACDQYYYVQTFSTDAHPTGCTADTIGAAANAQARAYNLLYQGDIAYATQIPTEITTAQILDLGSGFATGWSGEYPGTRLSRILGLAGYTGAAQWEGVTDVMGGANFAGVDAVSALQLVADTTAGQLWVDGYGQLHLDGRLWRYLQNTPTISFGENAGEVPYLDDVAIELDDTHIYNDVTVLNQPLPGAAQQPGAHTTDATSQAAYLPRSLQRTINVQDPTVPQSAAQYLLGQYAQPLARVGTLTIDPASNPALWSTVLGLAFGTRAQVSRRPPSGPGAAPITVQQFVEAVTWNGDDKGNLKLSLELSPAGPYLGWWVVASLHTTVAVASTAGTATVTLAPLTGSASNPAKAVLTPGTQLTLGYGTSSAETLTVQSVATTSPGYTSVAVTFTAATAHNHAVGETVCQPLPANYALPAAVQAGFPASLDAAATLSATTPRVAY